MEKTQCANQPFEGKNKTEFEATKQTEWINGILANSSSLFTKELKSLCSEPIETAQKTLKELMRKSSENIDRKVLRSYNWLKNIAGEVADEGVNKGKIYFSDEELSKLEALQIPTLIAGKRKQHVGNQTSDLDQKIEEISTENQGKSSQKDVLSLQDSSNDLQAEQTLFLPPDLPGEAERLRPTQIKQLPRDSRLMRLLNQQPLQAKLKQSQPTLKLLACQNLFLRNIKISSLPLPFVRSKRFSDVAHGQTQAVVTTRLLQQPSTLTSNSPKLITQASPSESQPQFKQPALASPPVSSGKASLSSEKGSTSKATGRPSASQEKAMCCCWSWSR